MSAQQLKKTLETIGFTEQNTENQENFEMSYIINKNFAILVSFYEESVILSYVFFKDGMGYFSKDYSELFNKTLTENVEKLSHIELLGYIKKLLEEFVGIDNQLTLLADVVQANVEFSSKGENEYKVVLTQSYSRTLTVRADDAFEAIDYVDSSIILFTDSNYVSESSNAEISD